MLIMVTVFCLLAGTLLSIYQRGHTQARYVREIEAINPGSVRFYYDYQTRMDPTQRQLFSSRPSFLGRMLGKDFVHRIERVEFSPLATDAQIKKCAQISGLKEVQLNGAVWPSRWESILDYPTLEHLHISCFSPVNARQKISLTDLNRFNRLRVLIVDGFELTEDNWNKILSLPRLKHLELFSTDSSVADFSRLPTSDSVEKFSWRPGSMVSQATLSGLIQHLPGLKTLSVWGGIQPMPMIPHAGQPGIDSSDTSSSDTTGEPILTPIDDQIFLSLRNCPRLENLSLFRTRVSGVNIEMLQSLPLKWIELPSSQLNDQGLAKLAKFPHLRQLEIGSTAVSDQGMKALSAAPKLVSLSIRDTQVTDEGMAALATLESLEKIRIRDTLITPDAIQEFLKINPDCKIDQQ